PDAEGITTVFIQAEGEDGIPQKVTLTNEEAVRAACTIGRQMREVTVGKKGYHSTAFDSFIVEYLSKGSLHRRNYSDRRNAAGMPDPEAYCAAAKTLVESEEFRRDTIASLHLDEFEEALDQFDEKSNVGRISVYAYLQSYGPSVEKWANAPDFRGGGGEMFTENAPDRVRHLLRVIRETVMKRTVETMGQNPVCTFQLDGRGVDRYLSATVRVYPGETELLSVWLGEQAERAEQLLTGGFTSVCACEVYRLHYDTPDFTDGNDPLSRGNPASITKAGSPEEAEKWIRNSISGNGMERYYAPEISQDEIWLFETDNYPEGYGIASGSETQMPEGVELLEQIRENPELYYLAKRRYLIAGR
ncbi:MAG: hypothetical protein IJ088_08525, partial [Clostridia bacterium]|nr:hypothetical protein [Clostridia bacterium]